MSRLALALLLTLAATLRAEDLPPPPPALSLTEATLIALERNGDLHVHRLEREQVATAIPAAIARFDPTVKAEAQRAWNRAPPLPDTTVDSAQFGFEWFLPTGTTLDAGLSTSRTEPAGVPWATRAGVDVTQALLQGAGLGPNLANVRRARLDLRISDFELRGFAIALVAEVEDAYWGLALANRRQAIVANAAAVAERQARDTAERIRLGRTAALEQAAADAELAARRQDQLDAAAALEQARLTLVRLLAADWGSAWTVSDEAAAPEPARQLSDHLRLAEHLRPDLQEARLERERGDLAVVETRSGLLPRLDLFATLGRTGYADSIGSSAPFGSSGDGRDASVGLRFSQALGNRAARAAARRAELDIARLDEAMANQRRLATFDVRSAHAEAQRAAAAVEPARATARARAEALRAAQAQEAVGRVASLLVAQAQRDLLAAELSAAEAAVRARTAMTALYRQDGTLLQLRAIDAPGIPPP